MNDTKVFPYISDQGTPSDLKHGAKAWKIENYLKKANHDKVKDDFMDFMDFIDFVS